MKQMHRFLSMLVCVALLISSVPASVLAEAVSDAAELVIMQDIPDEEPAEESIAPEEEDLVPMEILPLETEEIPAAEEESDPASFEPAPETELQQMTFANVITRLNAAEGAQPPFTVAEVTLPTDAQYNLYTEGVLPAPAEGEAYAFSTTDEFIAYVDENGNLKTKFSGEAVIGLSVNGGEEAKLNVKVTAQEKPAFAATLEKETIGVGMQTKVTANHPVRYDYTGDVIRLEADGTITGLKPGEAVITLTSADTDETASVSITVLPAPTQEQVRLAASEFSLTIGETVNLGASCAEGTMCEFEYESKAPSVAAVDADGNITAVGAGTAEILVLDDHNFLNELARCTVHVEGEPAYAISLSEESLVIGKGDSLDLKPLIRLPEGTYANFTYSTSAKKYVTVSEDGVIKGIAKGSATITVKTENGLSAKIKVTVRSLANASRMSLNAKELTLGVGMTAEAKVKFASGYGGLIEFISSNAAAAAVDASTGAITAVAPGEATITARLIQKKDVGVSMKLQVLPAVWSAQVSVNSLKLGLGQVSNALKGVCPAGTMSDFIYASSDENVAVVDAATGEITAVGKGTAQITVEPANNRGSIDTCFVEVVDAPYAITLRETALTIGKGDTFDLKPLVQLSEGSAASLSYSTGAKKYVTVSEDGVIKGVKKGSATITVKAHNGLSASIKVTVGNLAGASKIKFSPASLEVGVNSTAKLDVKFSSGYGGLYKLTSSDPSIVLVDDHGNVTGVKAGSAKITASLVQNPSVEKSISVTVKPAPRSIEASRASITLAVGQQSSAVQGVNPDPANTACGFVYESLNPDVVQADPETGKLTAVGVGKAEIIITADNNPEASARSAITVMEVNTAAMTIGVGDVCDLLEKIVHPDGADAGPYSFSTSAKKIVAVSAEGVIKGVKKGSANITIQNADGLNVKFKVTVGSYASAGKIRFDSDTLTLGEGMTGKLDVKFASGYAGLYTLESSRADVAGVDARGMVTALVPGETVITATLTKNPAIRASAHVQVLPAPQSISANVSELVLGAGQKSSDLRGVCPPGSLCAFRYSSDAPAVVRVDESTGELAALGTGTAQITIAPLSGSAAPVVCRVQVRPAPRTLSLKESERIIGKGDSFDLKQLIETNAGSAASFSYTTSAKKKVAVSEDGIIKGIAKGSATITVKSHNGLSAKIKITVRSLASASRMTLSPASLTLGVGMDSAAQLKFTSGYGGLVKFTSSNPSVATVDANGKIMAVGAGEAEITAALAQNSGVQKRMQVQVKPAPQSITASVASLKLGVGQVSSALQGKCPDNSMCGFIYSSDNASVARVDAATGEITAVGRGSAVITITASNNPAATAQCAVEVLKAPYRISVAESEISLGKGDRYDLNRLVNLPAGSAAALSYSTSAKKYVTVDADGMLKGAAIGSATITVKTHNGLSTRIKVSVKSAPKGLRLEESALTMGEGMRSQLKVRFEPASSYSVLSFTSSAENVAKVDAEGWITALSVGEATITAETLGGKQVSLTLKVVPGTTAIEFAQDAYSLSEEMELPTAILTDSGSMDSYIYASSDENVVAIDANGVLKGMGKGTATITVSTAKGVKNSRTCTVTVTPVPHVLDFNGMPDMVIAKGYPAAMPEPYAVDKAGDLVPTEFSYAFTKTAFSKIAKIEGNEITGIAAGEVVVRVKSHNGKSIDFTVKVINDTISGIELAHSSYALYIREGSSDSVALKGKVLGSKVSFGAPSYESTNPQVAAVDENGVVTAVAPGSTTIIAQAYTGISAGCEITVGTLTGSLSFADTAPVLTEGYQLQLAPVFDPGTGARMQYVSSDAAVAVVDENGLVTAIKPGSAVITATTQNDLTAQLNLKVLAAPAAIYLSASGLNLAAGESVVLKPEVLKAANASPDAEVDSSVSYASSAPGIAKVDAGGVVTAVSAGTAVITAETCNGLTAECTVKVLAKAGSAKTEFAFQTATIIKGDTAALQFNLSKDAYERGFTLQSSDPAKLQVDARNWTIQALAAAPDGITLSLQVNPPEGEMASENDAVTAQVKILEKSEAKFSAEEIALRRGESAALQLENLSADLIGTFEILVEDEAVAVYDAKTGIVQAMDLVAETKVICRLYDREIACRVRIVPTYRALIISEFNKSKEGALPFAQSNVDAMYETLYMSLIDGQTYSTNVLSSNPTQAQIASAISSSFAGAREGDVSLVYIVSHGYYNKDNIKGYCFGTPGWSAKKPDTYITSDELFGWLDAIPGNVILMLDSCKSGGFIRDTKDRLEADGNIAVITAQAYNKNASFFVKGDGSSVEFLTYALCAGFGYDYENGVPTGSLKADANGNGEVTIEECFKYTKSTTTSLVKSKASYFKAGTSTGFLVPGVKTNSQLKSWGGQNPQTYIPSAMEDIVIYSE